MSLASETQRVQLGIKGTFRALLQKLGVTVGDELVDGYPALAETISNKLLPDNLLSAATAALYGKDADATPNDVFSAISEILSGKAELHTFSYSGTGTYQEAGASSISADKPILLALMLYYKDNECNITPVLGRDHYGRDWYAFMFGPVLTTEYVEELGFGSSETSGSASYDFYGKKSADGKTFYWYSEGVSSGENQLNKAGYTYYGCYFC